jgi:hypothetical protein
MTRERGRLGAYLDLELEEGRTLPVEVPRHFQKKELFAHWCLPG